MKALVGAFNQEKALVGAFSVIVQPHSENSPTRELPTADCCKTGIFDNKYREESFIFIWLSKKGLASMTKSVMIIQGIEKV